MCCHLYLGVSFLAWPLNLAAALMCLIINSKHKLCEVIFIKKPHKWTEDLRGDNEKASPWTIATYKTSNLKGNYATFSSISHLINIW